MTTPLTRTTRLTAPEPTGLDKMFQDKWDERRDSQVRTYMTFDSKTAFANFEGAVQQGIIRAIAERDKAREEGSPKGALIWTHVCGSYDRTDIPEKGTDPIDVFMKQLGTSSKSPLTKMFNRNNLHIAKKGVLSTGTFHYSDGSMDVCDPLKGIQISSSDTKKLVDMKSIETMYVWILAIV